MYTHLFTAVPDKKKSYELNCLVREIICQKLISIISQVGEQLETSFESEIKKLQDYYKDGLINPALFHYYFKLKEAIESGDLNFILDTISILAHQPITINRKNGDLPDIMSVVNSEWEKNLFNESARKDSVSDFGMKNQFEIIHPVFKQDLIAQETSIKEALIVLNEIDAIHHFTAVSPLCAIKIFKGTVRGFSYQAAYGNIYIRTPQAGDNPTAYYLEHIVHECAHQNLFALQLIDPVVLNAKGELYDAPIRIQKRPMDGIFHACFVLSRMVRCFRRTDNHLDSKSNIEFTKRIDSWFEKSYITVKEHAKLTDYGKRLFNTFQECAYE